MKIYLTAVTAYSLLITAFWCFDFPRGTLPAASKTSGKPVSKAANNDKPTQHLLETVQSSPTPETAALRTINWNDLESEDFATYANNLRAMGCPERVVRQIMTIEVRDSFDQDRRSLMERELTPFWDSSYGGNEEMAEEFEKLADAETAFLSSLIGPLDAATLNEIRSRRIEPGYRFGERLAQKKQAVLDVFTQAKQAINQLPENHAPGMLEQIEAQTEAALEALLTPQEREDFEIRNSPMAAEIREIIRSKGGEVGEEQFRQLFRMRKELADQLDLAADSGGNVASLFDQFHDQISAALANIP